MIMDPGFSVRFIDDSPYPDFPCSTASMIDGSLPKHSRDPGGVGIELIAPTKRTPLCFQWSA